jgi:uncharacterized membrane protein
MHYLYLLSVWIHILAAIVWIGGAAFLVLVLMPALRRPEYQAVSSPLLRWSAMRFRRIGWISLSTLILTGIFNLGFRGFSWASLFDGSLFHGPFGRLLAVKLSLVGFILFISLLHDFFLGPRAASAILADPGSPEAKRGRLIAAWMGRLTLTTALAVVAAGVALVRGWPG